MSYDTRCEELADIFLADAKGVERNERNTRDLAQHIQNAIEEWLEEHGE